MTSSSAPTPADTRKRLEAIKERCEAATPGPWEIRREWSNGVEGCRWIKSASRAVATVTGAPGFDHSPDAAFIASSIDDIPFLLSLLAADAETFDALERLCERWGGFSAHEGMINDVRRILATRQHRAERAKESST